MKLNSKFNSAVAGSAVFGLFFFVTPASADASPTASWYRDGDRWIHAARVQTVTAGRQRVRLTSGAKTTEAVIGRRAILQLSAAIDPSAFMRRHRLQASSPVRRRDLDEDSGLLAPRFSSEAHPPALNPRLRLYRVESLDGLDGLTLAAKLSTLSEVEAALPDLYLERRKAAGDFEVPPDDPRYRGQWYFSRIELDRVWRVTPGDRETTIVVIDDGCDMEHPDLVDALRGGIDVIDEDDDPSFTPNVEGNEHGTACAGIIAATGNNGIGIAGACPRCSLRCVRLFGRNHSLIPLSADIAAFDYVYETGSAAVSNSWGFADPQPVPFVLRMAIEEVVDRGRNGRGALVVFAAGNENRRIEDDEIAAIPGVVNVGAVNNFDEAAPFSNSGNSLMLTAPTGSLTTDISGPDGAGPSDYTSLFGGTSSACPVVAGVGALLMSAVPERTAREIGELLRGSARSAPFAVPNASGHDPLYGYGILDPAGAFEAAGLEVPQPPAPRDAGTPDASQPDSAPAANSGKDDSGCTVSKPGTRSEQQLSLAAWTFGALLLRRRRRRKPRQ